MLQYWDMRLLANILDFSLLLGENGKNTNEEFVLQTYLMASTGKQQESHIINRGKKNFKIDVTTSQLWLPAKKLQAKRLRTLG